VDRHLPCLRFRDEGRQGTTLNAPTQAISRALMPYYLPGIVYALGGGPGVVAQPYPGN